MNASRPAVGFGLDLAGYGQGKTSLAAIEPKGNAADVTLLLKSVFSPKRKFDLNEPLAKIVTLEIQTLRTCLVSGPVAIDVPIDLQNLRAPKSCKRPWELTFRPVDKALTALAPLASLIGAPVARFRHIVEEGQFIVPKSSQDFETQNTIFETYPKGTLRLWWSDDDKDVKEYKNKKDAKKAANARRNLCARLNVRLDEVIEELTDDDIDAILCSLAAVAVESEVWTEDDLKRRLKERFGEGRHKLSEEDVANARLPKNYRILKAHNPFTEIRVKAKPFDDWMKVRSPK